MAVLCCIQVRFLAFFLPVVGSVHDEMRWMASAVLTVRDEMHWMLALQAMPGWYMELVSP